MPALRALSSSALCETEISAPSSTMAQQLQGGVNAIQRRFEELDKSLEIRDTGNQRRFEELDKRFEKLDKSLEIRDRGIKREFQNVHERMDRTDTRIDRIECTMNEFKTLLRNSKIAHLRQSIIPCLVYDKNGLPIPVPKEFPSTALKFYHLQDRKHWPKLRDLIVYYGLEKEIIRSIADYGSDPDFDSDSESEYREQDLKHAISSNVWRAVVILGAHLGVDCDAIHDRVVQLEFHQQNQIANKRIASDHSSGRPIAKRRPTLSELIGNVSDAQREAAANESSDEVRTTLNWEVDSGKFQRTVAHLTFRDIEPHILLAQNIKETASSPCSPKRQRGHRSVDVPVRPSGETEKMKSPLDTIPFSEDQRGGQS